MQQYADFYKNEDAQVLYDELGHLERDIDQLQLSQEQGKKHSEAMKLLYEERSFILSVIKHIAKYEN